MPTKSANNALDLTYINFDASNNRIDFTLPISSNAETIGGEDSWVREQTNAAFLQANSAFSSANNVDLTPAFEQANAAFEAANNATDPWVRTQANLAFDKANTAAQLDFNTSSTGYFKLPSGTTAQRPGSPSGGMIRYNTTTGEPEWYDPIGNQWLFLSQPSLVPITAFLWGGGGGSGGSPSGGAGGGGGAAPRTFTVSKDNPIAVVVGGGGQSQGPNAGTGPAVPGGGGLPGSVGYGGAGGGYSGIFINSASQANAILIAGGGGGGSYEGAVGGAGGGTEGISGGSGASLGGGGGTQSAGGTSGSTPGSALQGGQSSGDDNGGGGGGGGGYFGGGGGRNNNPGAAGGGGSGYFNTNTVTNASLYQGSGTIPGNSTESLRSGSGNGGATGVNAGVSGRVVLRYLGTTTRATGGTITNDGTYTYHTFTSAGTFTVTI